MRHVPLAVVLSLVLAGVPGPALAYGGAPNEPPLADAGLDQRVERGTTVRLDGAGSVDPDGEIASYEWSIGGPDGAEVTPADPTGASTTFDASTVGRYAVTLTVTDDRGAVRSDTLYVTVTDAATDAAAGDNATAATPNRPPTGRIDGPDTVVRGEAATFVANVYDPDGEIVSYEWSDGRSGRSIARSVDVPAGEAFVFSVRVIDDDGATSTFRTSVLVRAADTVDGGGPSVDPDNRRPSASIDGPERVAVGREASFVLRGSDPDGTIAGRRWTAPSEADGGVLRHTFDAVGTYTVAGTVVDDDGARATASRTVEVYDEGPPVVTIDGPDTAPTGSTRAYTLDAVDPDGGELTVRWSPGQNQLEREASRFVNRVEIYGGIGDTVSVTATVTDDEGDSVTVVKETDVQRSIRVGDSFDVPTVSEIRYGYHTDLSHREPDGDTVELGAYDFSTSVSYGEGKLVRVTWEFNDSTTMSQTLGRFSGEKRSSVRHTFISETGGRITRSVRVTATDADGQSTSRKWVSRVHSVATDDEVVFEAFAPGSSVPETDLAIEPGDRVDFRVGSYHDYKIEFGDGSETEAEGSPGYLELSHVYEDPGTYTTRLFSSQGGAGKAIETVVVTVQPSSYVEYWYQVESGRIEQVVSDAEPEGNGWYELTVHDSGRTFTGRTREVVTTGPRLAFTDDNWVRTGSRTETRTREIRRTRRRDPDGAGDAWRLSRSRVHSETVTTYRDQYRWVEWRYLQSGWRFTGETRTRRVVHGDGHDHDRTRHSRRIRGGCTDWDLDPGPWGGFSRSCSRWNYRTDVWYSGHDHDGWTDWDTDYRFHREVARTETVWYHEYVGTRTYTVTVERYAETEEWVEWLWERRLTEPKRSFSLTRPERGTYIAGTLERVEVRCGTEQSHFDHVVC